MSKLIHHQQQFGGGQLRSNVQYFDCIFCGNWSFADNSTLNKDYFHLIVFLPSSSSAAFTPTKASSQNNAFAINNRNRTHYPFPVCVVVTIDIIRRVPIGPLAAIMGGTIDG